nr:cytochrome-c peroxidase [Sphingobacterium hotanense]
MGKEKPALIALGKTLFWDNNVGSGTRSCLSCHNPENYRTDAKRTADGIATHHRNTPTMQNVWTLEGHLFHDGRAKTFREQIAEAIESPIEMGGNTYTLPAKLQAVPGYVRMYEEAYGTRELTREGLLDAIAAYSKTISSGITAFDRFVAGDYQSLSDEQIEGLHLFRTKGQCINCHNGPFFTDLNYHNLGYAVDVFGKLDDGRYIVTKNRNDLGKIRTPGLRVHPFCQRVPIAVIFLCHAYGNLLLLQQFRIFLATILYPPVRVMNEPFGILGVPQGHFKCFYPSFDPKAPRYIPSHYFPGIGIRDQEKINKPLSSPQVCNVRYVRLLRPMYDAAPQQVAIGIEPMIAVGGTDVFPFPLDQQIIIAQ